MTACGATVFPSRVPTTHRLDADVKCNTYGFQWRDNQKPKKTKKNIFFNKMWFPKSIQTKKIEMISKKYLKPFSVKRKLDRCSVVDA